MICVENTAGRSSSERYVTRLYLQRCNFTNVPQSRKLKHKADVMERLLEAESESAKKTASEQTV